MHAKMLGVPAGIDEDRIREAFMRTVIRPGKALNETKPDRVFRYEEDDGDCRGRLRYHHRRGTAGCHNDGDLGRTSSAAITDKRST
jgi:hypothetical protein